MDKMEKGGLVRVKAGRLAGREATVYWVSGDGSRIGAKFGHATAADGPKFLDTMFWFSMADVEAVSWGYERDGMEEVHRCARCAGTGAFITCVVNGQPSGPGGSCFRCGGKGRVNGEDRERNWGFDMFGRRVR